MIEHLSASSLKMFSRCAYQWLLYQEHGPIPPGIALIVGSSVHKGAELNNRHKLATEEDLPEDDVIDAARSEFAARLDKEGLYLTREEEPMASKLLGDGVDTAVDLARLWRREVAPPIQPALVEERISIRLAELDLPVIGYVDCVDRDHTLIETKTASKSWTANTADEEIQPTLYRELVRSHTGRAPEKIRYDILVKTKTPKSQSIELVRDDSDWAALIERMRAMLAQIQAGSFPPCAPGWQCSEKFCGYWAICKYVPARLKSLPRTQ